MELGIHLKIPKSRHLLSTDALPSSHLGVLCCHPNKWSDPESIWSRLQSKSLSKQPQHSLSSLSKDFQRLEGQRCRQLLSCSNRESEDGVEPSPDGAPLRSVIVLTEVEGWAWEGEGVHVGWVCASSGSVSWNLGHNETSSSNSHPSLLVGGDRCQKPPISWIQAAFFFFFASRRLDRCAAPTLKPPPHPRLPSLAAPNARRLSGISSCPCSSQGWGSGGVGAG